MIQTFPSLVFLLKYNSGQQLSNQQQSQFTQKIKIFGM